MESDHQLTNNNGEYLNFRDDIMRRIRSAQYEAMRAVNKEMISLYWDIGRQITERQKELGWGNSVVENLSKDIQKEFPGITILAEDYTDGTVEGARQKASDLLTRFPNTNGLFAVNQPSAVGTYKAIQAHGQAGKIKYVGFDSDSLLVQAIEDGSCVGLIVQDPLQIG